MGKTIYSDHPTLEEGAQVYFLSWERTDESYHGIRISARHGSMYHYEQDGTYWLRSERYPQGRRSVFTLEQGENGFDFRENETGKYLSYCNGYV